MIKWVLAPFSSIWLIFKTKLSQVTIFIIKNRNLESSVLIPCHWLSRTFSAKASLRNISAFFSILSSTYVSRTSQRVQNYQFESKFIPSFLHIDIPATDPDTPLGISVTFDLKNLTYRPQKINHRLFWLCYQSIQHSSSSGHTAPGSLSSRSGCGDILVVGENKSLMSGKHKFQAKVQSDHGHLATFKKASMISFHRFHRWHRCLSLWWRVLRFR